MSIPKLAGTLTAMLVLALSTAASAVQVTGGELMPLPQESWHLMGTGLTAQGVFALGSAPEGNFSGPGALGNAVQTAWTSGSVDGFGGTMILNGMPFNLASSSIDTEQSIMNVTANGFTVDHFGSYQQPFAFSADFCGWITISSPGPCDTSVSLSGNGTVRMVVAPISGEPEGTFGIESISYTFGNATNVPEPASLDLLLVGVALIGCRRHLRYLIKQFGEPCS
jgi:PEP-CTERM motif